MAEGKYDQYFITNVVKENKFGGEGISVSSVPADIIPASAKISLAVTAVKKPYMFHDKVHKHIFTEFFVFFGSNPQDMQDFDADVEFSFGAEKEKRVIKDPTIVVAPPGTYHCPLNYARIGQPIFCIEAFMTSKYSGVDLGEDIYEVRTEEESYKRFFTSGVVRDNLHGGEAIVMGHVPEHIVPAASRINMAISTIKKPLTFLPKTHKHSFTEIFIFMGSNPLNMNEFGAEMEFCIGAEKEKHTIKSPTIIVVPPGIYHGPFEITKMEKPIYSIETFITSKYSETELAKT